MLLLIEYAYFFYLKQQANTFYSPDCYCCLMMQRCKA